jgi:hypothetical protein
MPGGGDVLVAATERLTGDLDTEAREAPVMNQTVMACSSCRNVCGLIPAGL